MKVHRDDHPEISLAEIKAQIATGAMTKWDLWDIIEKYRKSAYYLPEDVLRFLEEYLNTKIRRKNEFYLRDKDDNPKKS